MGKALYRKYRSRSLHEIVGQSHVTDILTRAIETGNIAHAYLFTGPRGVGKTSIARILAHEINQLAYDEDSNHLDIIEIDAASNNGVDDIRDLREKVQLAPSQAKKKVYIIDEVHMLSKPAFNALLKTLEEPPEHIVFILATTDVDKLPDTIISRTQRYSFKKASTTDIISNLSRIAHAESIQIDENALHLIAEQSGGSYRDSISLLDQLRTVVSDDKIITATHVETVLGLPPDETIIRLLDHARRQQFDETVQLLKTLDQQGTQPRVTADRLVHTIIRDAGTYGELFDIIDELIEVSKSPLPEAKLLAILGKKASPIVTPKSTSKPLLAAAPKTVTAAEKALPELAAKADEPMPKDDIIIDTSAPKRKRAKSTVPIDLDWNSLLLETKTGSIALYSVLTKCDYDTDGSELTIYCKNEFYKKKLDSVKFRQQLGDSLQKLTSEEWDILTIPGAKPSSNSQVAAIAAMMGGGEEVSVDSL